jgi:hypothetical protein
MSKNSEIKAIKAIIDKCQRYIDNAENDAQKAEYNKMRLKKVALLPKNQWKKYGLEKVEEVLIREEGEKSPRILDYKYIEIIPEEPEEEIEEEE